MRVVATKTINAYCECYPEAAGSLRAWKALIESRDYKHIADLKQTFGTVDQINNNIYVFNIKGNQFRLIAGIDFQRKAAYVKWFGRHKEYDNINPSEVKHEYPPC